MNINIINKTSYNQVGIIYKETQLAIKKDESVLLDISSDEPKIEVLIYDKNRVLLNLFFALIDGFIDGESVINSLYCNVMFNIGFQEENTTVVLKDLEYRDDKNGYIYESVYIEHDNIKDTLYSLTNTDNAQKKAWFYYIFLVSWLLVIIVLLGYYLLFKGNILTIFASVLIFFMFTIPSWKKALKIKKYYNSEYANEVLLAQVAKQKQNKHNNVNQKTDNALWNSVYKAVDFLLKNK